MLIEINRGQKKAVYRAQKPICHMTAHSSLRFGHVEVQIARGEAGLGDSQSPAPPLRRPKPQDAAAPPIEALRRLRMMA